MTGSSRRSDRGSEGDKAASREPSPLVEQGRSSQGAGKGKRLRPPPPKDGTPGTSGVSAAAAGGGSSDPGDAMQVDAPPSTHAAVAAADVRLPLDLNARVMCKWKDGDYHSCKILERRSNSNWEGGKEEPSAWEYYVHWARMNRRMDEWVCGGDMDLSTVELEVETWGPDGKKRKKVDEHHDDDDEEHGDFDPQALREHEEFTKVKNIEVIQLGQHEMDTWYFSPFPPEYKDCKKLYFCEFSLHFFKRRTQLLRHLTKCKVRHPPGDEIYRKDNVAMFEIDGKAEKTYCQHLCYLAKLFLDHKTLYYDVDLFLFYVLCEVDARGAHIVGYFSKEKSSEEGYNLACILTLPCYQRKGYGKFLISMSYELSKLEGKVGTPERPLSDLGLVSYRSYWTRVLLPVLSDHEGAISIKELSELSSIKPDDIVNTLTHLNLIQYQKGQHVICAAPRVLEKLLKEAGGPGLQVDPGKIIWTPYNAEKELQSYRN